MRIFVINMVLWLNRIYIVLLLYIGHVDSSISGIDRRHFNSQERLIKKLITDSESTKQILPMLNASRPVVLKINLAIRQISTVDEVNQALRLNVWLRLKWDNPFLTWSPDEYGNITSIHLDNGLIWTPDIAMYNKASLEEEIDILYKRMSTPVVIEHNGTCSWNSPATLLSQCRINVRQFPFDQQECLLVFGSWTYSALKLNVEPNGVDMKDYLHNGEWNVLGYPMKRNVKNYSGDIPFADVTLSFRIKRQPLYYTLNLILPCTVIAILAFLSFALPTSHGERVSLVITVLLAMSVYMLIVSSTLPQTSDAMPIIGTYFLCIIVEIAMCLLATCLVCKLQDHEGDIPQWLDNLLNKRVARLLFIRTTAEDYEEIPKIEKVNGHSKQIDLRVLSTKLTESSAEIQLINKKMLQKFQDELAVLTNDVKKRQKHNAKQRKWKNAARVLDRLFLVLFPFVFIIVTTAVFASKA